MRLLNTHRKQDLKRFAQAIMLVNDYEVVDLKDITLLEFSGGNVIVDYLLFRVGQMEYSYRLGKGLKPIYPTFETV